MTDARQEVVEMVPPQNEAGQLLDVIRVVAKDKDFDIEKVKAIFAMQRELQEDANRREFNAAMAEAQAEIEPVVRNAENADNHQKYSTLDAIGNAIDKIVTAHGFSTIFMPQSTAEKDEPPIASNCIRVKMILAHARGFERKIVGDIPIDATGLKGTVNKTATHAWGSTVTYARRYLIMMAFNVKSARLFPDNDASASETITDDQAAALLGEIDKQAGKTFDAIVKAYSLPDVVGVSRLDVIRKLPADQFADCVQRLNDRRAASAAKAKSGEAKP